MSDGVISQDEIDALLSSVDGGLGGLGGGSSSGGSSNIDTATLQKFADKMKDKLVATFNGTTGKDVFTVGTPTVEAVSRDQLLSKVPEDVVAVMADYKTALTGDHLFVFAPEFVQKVGSLVDPSMEEAMVFEVIKEIVGGHSGSEISDLCAGGKLAGLETIPPEISKQPKAAVRMPEGNFALFSYPLTVEGTEFTMWEAISSSVAEGMTKSINGGSSPSPARWGVWAPVPPRCPHLSSPSCTARAPRPPSSSKRNFSVSSSLLFLLIVIPYLICLVVAAGGVALGPPVRLPGQEPSAACVFWVII